MIYELKNNIIKIHDKTQFNPEHILECGQVFRYGKDEDNNYYVISKNYKATIIEKDSHYEIISNNPNYFVEYFDLNTDYNIIKTNLKNNKTLSPMIDYGYGIRILKADALEMIFSFTISQNNNIKRIKQIIERLCELGLTNDSGYKNFPTQKELFDAPIEFYENLGAGYRAKFLKDLSIALLNTNLDEIKNLSTDEIYNFLINLKGIGPKVASCILLFGFNRTDKFPVDTWIEQVYNHFSKEKRKREQIQTYFEEIFGNYSGIAQQYLFFYERKK